MIRTQSVSKSYGAVHALDDVSLRLPSGAVTGVLGPNGSGKSTLFRILLGLTPPDQGAVVIDDAVQPAGTSPQRRAIGNVPDSDELYEDLSPDELARLTWSVHARLVGADTQFPADRFERLCDLFGLGEHLHRLSRDLSHGTRRKAQLLANLTCRPQVLVIDEPTNGLDPDQHVVLKLVLRSLADSGTTIVVSTHNLGFAEGLCDHVVLLRSRVVMAGPPQQVLGRTGTANLPEAYEALTGIDRDRIAREAAEAFQ
ncbi:ABC transporter ATP-binding protein [Angustibacter sp. McL0619]|uniref:ABC transporter ATP-binding protein n=1 Tax=Angustibacter sp. McL0619 TaxID=3415676 RepID=UPI003CF78F6F